MEQCGVLATTEDQILRAQKNYDFLRMTWCDLNAISRSKIITSPCFDKFLRHGMEVWAGCLAMGYNSDITPLDEVMVLDDGNCSALPVLSTLHDVPWTSSKLRVGEVLCETHWIQTGEPQSANPRYVARRQLHALQQMGFTLYSAFETELTVADAESHEACLPKQTLFSNYAFAHVEEMLLQASSNLGAAGVQLENMHTEYGKGQLELVQRPTYGIEVADGNMILRDCVKETCLKQGKHATFMTKPLSGSNSNGLHFNHSLFDTESNVNVFADPTKEYKLSDTARHWLAGLIKHTPALCGLSCPTVNCYRRLHTPWAPDRNNWGVDNRSATHRVKNYDANRTYFENRLPAAAANPYLVLAGTVAAGLDGLINRLEPPPAKDPSAAELPQTLAEALNCLENDQVLIQALGEGFVDWFLKIKRSLEVDAFSDWAESRDRPETFQKERDLYYMFL